MKELYIKISGKFRHATGSEVCEAASKYVFEEAISTKRVIRSAADAKEYLSRQAGVAHEQFGVVFLDNRSRVLSIEIMFEGTVNCAAVHTREVAKKALAFNASSIMIFHNHPSGCCEPSADDIRLTRRMVDAMALLDIQVLDHILVAGLKTVSFTERNLMGGSPDGQG